MTLAGLSRPRFLPVPQKNPSPPGVLMIACRWGVAGLLRTAAWAAGRRCLPLQLRSGRRHRLDEALQVWVRAIHAQPRP